MLRVAGAEMKTMRSEYRAASSRKHACRRGACAWNLHAVARRCRGVPRLRAMQSSHLTYLRRRRERRFQVEWSCSRTRCPFTTRLLPDRGRHRRSRAVGHDFSETGTCAIRPAHVTPLWWRPLHPDRSCRTSPELPCAGRARAPTRTWKRNQRRRTLAIQPYSLPLPFAALPALPPSLPPSAPKGRPPCADSPVIRSRARRSSVPSSGP